MTLSVVAALPGGPELRDLLRSGLSVADRNRVVRPLLAEAVPSIENGLWKLLPDGTMETTWRLREGVRWHDGSPVTPHDFLFTLQVARDPEIAVFTHTGLAFLDRVDTPDGRTIVARWKQTFIDADQLFSEDFVPPHPAHLLESAYATDRAAYVDLPYWNKDFVGTGPFLLKEWAAGSHLVLGANDAFVLGRPKIDEIIVKFIRDPNVLLASLLADDVLWSVGRSLTTLDQAVQLREQWPRGRVDLAYRGRIVVVTQFINPSPPVIANAQLRRALLHAIDRQAMADALVLGLTAVSESYLSPGQADFREAEARLPRYPYDPVRAARLFEEISLSRGADGLLRDATGAPLVTEARTSAGDDLQEKSLFSVVDYWQRAGVTIDTVLVPSQRQQDREYRANHPGFELYRQPDDLPTLGDLHGSQAPTSQNNYTGRNRSRYQNAEFDALLDRYFGTIPLDERNRIVGDIVYHIQDQLTIMGLFYNAYPGALSNRLVNAEAAGQGRATWNAHTWDLQ